MHLEGCSSSLFQPVFREARSGGTSASLRMVAGQSISFCAPWDEEMGAGSWLWRWGVFLTYREPSSYWGGFRGVVNLTPEVGPLAMARDGENVMTSGMEEPVQEIAAKGSIGEIISSSLAGANDAVALGRAECGGRQHPSWGFTKGSGGVKGAHKGGGLASRRVTSRAGA